MTHAPGNCKRVTIPPPNCNKNFHDQGLQGTPNQSLSSIPVFATKVMWAPVGKDKDIALLDDFLRNISSLVFD